jgi:hypothetical protein
LDTLVEGIKSDNPVNAEDLIQLLETFGSQFRALDLGMCGTESTCQMLDTSHTTTPVMNQMKVADMRKVLEGLPNLEELTLRRLPEISDPVYPSHEMRGLCLNRLYKIHLDHPAKSAWNYSEEFIKGVTSYDFEI